MLSYAVAVFCAVQAIYTGKMIGVISSSRKAFIVASMNTASVFVNGHIRMRGIIYIGMLQI